MADSDGEGLRVKDVTTEEDLVAVSLLNEFIADRVLIAGQAGTITPSDFEVSVEDDADEKAMPKIVLTHKSGDKFVTEPRLVGLYVHGAEKAHARAIAMNPMFALLIVPVFTRLHAQMMDMAGRAALSYCLVNRL